MRWQKHGIIWRPDGSLWWARSHATCPTPIVLRNGTLRVYLQSRDEHNVGRIGYVDLDPNDPRHILAICQTPVLDVGKPGAFDDNGVYQGCVIRDADGNLRLYYVGYELCHHIRYRLLTGLAISTDEGQSFQRYQTTPILERSPQETCFRGGPWVTWEAGRYRMWYVAGSEWEMIDGKMMPLYALHYMESDDGIHWPSHGSPVLSINMDEEHGFGRPLVEPRAEGGYQMHYSIRKRHPRQYRMGYAQSADGLVWERQDEKLNIDVSPEGWDAESVEYGCPYTVNGKTWLFYNGNDFGGTGFGIAELLEP